MHGSTDYETGYADAVRGLPCCPPEDSETSVYKIGYRDGLGEWSRNQVSEARSLAARLLPSARVGVGVAS